MNCPSNRYWTISNRCSELFQPNVWIRDGVLKVMRRPVRIGDTNSMPTPINAKDAKYAFRWLCGGNICFHRPLHDAIGGFDESFTAWGAEDQEYGYRMYRAGAWFIPVENAVGLHQEPPGRVERDRSRFRSLHYP